MIDEAFVPEVREAEVEYTEQPSKTWRLDLKNNRITKEIDDLEAVVQSAYMALQTDRYTYPIFSWQYGSELHTLIGKERDYALSEAKRMIEDALLPDTRIKEVRDFVLDGDVLYFVIDTIFGVATLSREAYLT